MLTITGQCILRAILGGTATIIIAISLAYLSYAAQPAEASEQVNQAVGFFTGITTYYASFFYFLWETYKIRRYNKIFFAALFIPIVPEIFYVAGMSSLPAMIGFHLFITGVVLYQMQVLFYQKIQKS